MIPPIVATLLANGLGILGNAVLAKGQDVIEQKLGVKLKAQPTEQELSIYRQMEIDHEEFLMEAALKKQEMELAADKNAQENVTKRWEADMLSDSYLSKNIRPFVLIFLLVVYSLFSLLSIWGWNVRESYVELLAQMLMLVMGAYFLGRSVEKIVDMKERGK